MWGEHIQNNDKLLDVTVLNCSKLTRISGAEPRCKSGRKTFEQVKKHKRVRKDIFPQVPNSVSTLMIAVIPSAR